MGAAGRRTSAKYQAFLFGAMRIEKNGKEIPLPRSASARSLLAHFLLHHRTSQTRAALLGLFWPELDETRARRALSQSLWQIRRLVPDLLAVSVDSIAVSPTIRLTVDAETFERMAMPESTRDELEQAAALYRADLLEGDYHDWALLERERLREMYLQTLERLGQMEKAAGRFAKALELAQCLSRADPLNESAHREVMLLHQSLAQPEAALRQFDLCRQTLHQELNVEPEAETLTLAEEIRRRAEKEQPPQEALIPAPLVGREAERAALLRFVEGVFEKLGGLVLLEGEAGVGKTRLLQEIAREAKWRGAQVLWGHARETQGLKPYAPLVEALQSGLSPLRVAQIGQAVERVWLQALAPLLAPHPALPAFEAAPPLTPAQEGARLIEAIVRLLEGWSGIVPLVVILEDLHWAGGDTLSLLPALTRRLGRVGVLIVGSYRSEEIRARPEVWEAMQAVGRANLLERRVLPRLDEAASGELIRRSLGLASPAPLFEERLFRETDGNPLFILETLRALRDEGLLKRGERGGWSTPWDETTRDYAELPLPPLVEKVITGRLERLPKPLRHTLRVMAALGSQFEFDALAAALGLEIHDTLQAARELIRRSFLKETADGYRFEHDKIHQIVYAEIGDAERVKLHRRIAAHLAKTRPGEPAALAWHFWRGEEWEQAARYNQLAAQAAMSLYANQEARTYLTRALDALDKIPRPAPSLRADLLRARQTVNGLLGDRPAQRDDLQALEALAASPAERAKQSLRWAGYYEVTSDYPSAIRAAQTAIALAKAENNLSLAAAGQTLLGRVLNMQADPQGTQAALTSALENARAAQDDRQIANCLHALARYYYDYQNRYEEGLACCREALGIAQALTDRGLEASVRHMMSNLLNDLGYLDETMQEKLTVLRLRREIGDRRGEAMILYSLGIFHRDRGDNEASLEHVRASLTIAEAIGDPRLEAYDRTYVGLLMEERDPEESLRQYARALEIRRQIGQHALAVDTLAGLARACLQLGRVEQAKAHIAEALDWVAEHGTFAVGDIELVYLAAYRVFTAASEGERAMQVIQAAYDDLMARAATVPEGEARQKFLSSVPQHEQVLELHRRMQCRQAAVRLPRANNPGETVEVAWTPSAPEDEAISNKVVRRRHRLARLTREAGEQGALATCQNLAEALGASLRTIERDMAEMKKK